MIPIMQALPEFLSETKYRNITELTNTALQRGLSTPDTLYIYLQKHPKKFNHFSQFMTAHHEGLGTWLDVYPIIQETTDFDSIKPLFVDIGSGIGHQCLALKTKYPEYDQPGRLIMQDLEPVLAEALPMVNVTKMAFDFFAASQPIKGINPYPALSVSIFI